MCGRGDPLGDKAVEEPDAKRGGVRLLDQFVAEHYEKE